MILTGSVLVEFATPIVAGVLWKKTLENLTHRCRRKKSLVPVDDGAHGPDLAKKTTMAIKADEKSRRCWEEPACPSNCISRDKRKNGVREGGG